MSENVPDSAVDESSARASSIRPDLARLREGLCPVCGSVLERRDDCGWCLSCNFGHSVVGDAYSLHVPLGLPVGTVYWMPWAASEIHAPCGASVGASGDERVNRDESGRSPAQGELEP